MKLKKKYSLKEISSIYNCTIVGNELLDVDSVCSLSNSKKKSLTYISDLKYLSLLDKSKLDCLITTKEISKLIAIPSISLIIHENPLLLFSEIINDSIDVSGSSFFL